MKDPIREAWLIKHGWEFEYRPDVQLSRILLDKSASQQIRMSETIDHAHAGRLKLALSDGAKLPPVLLARVDKDGSFYVADGVHRISAVQANGVSAIDAYVITNVHTEDDLENLRRTANAPGGKGFSVEEAIRQALYLVQRQGWTSVRAAKSMHVSETSISKHLRVGAVGERAAMAAPGVTLSKISQDTLDAIGRIRRDDLFREAIVLAARGAFNRENSRQLAGEAASITTDAQAAVLLSR